jgi:hypothetical protein
LTARTTAARSVIASHHRQAPALMSSNESFPFTKKTTVRIVRSAPRPVRQLSAAFLTLASWLSAACWRSLSSSSSRRLVPRAGATAAARSLAASPLADQITHSANGAPHPSSDAGRSGCTWLHLHCAVTRRLLISASAGRSAGSRSDSASPTASGVVVTTLRTGCVETVGWRHLGQVPSKTISVAFPPEGMTRARRTLAAWSLSSWLGSSNHGRTVGGGSQNRLRIHLVIRLCVMPG